MNETEAIVLDEEPKEGFGRRAVYLDADPLGQIAHIPYGSIIYTPEEQERYKAEKEAELQKKAKEAERKLWYKNTPKFCFVSAEKLESEVKPETMARLIYLSTFLDYSGGLKINNKTPMRFSDLAYVLKIGKSSVYSFWKEVDSKYMFADRNGALYMSQKFSFRGKMLPKTSKQYQCAFIDSVRKLYSETEGKQVRYLGYVFFMLPFVNMEYNIICKNPFERDIELVEPISIDEFCTEIGYDTTNKGRLVKTYTRIRFPADNRSERFCAFVTNDWTMGNAKIIVNPRVLYRGTSADSLQAISKICDFA